MRRLFGAHRWPFPGIVHVNRIATDNRSVTITPPGRAGLKSETGVGRRKPSTNNVVNPIQPKGSLTYASLSISGLARAPITSDEGPPAQSHVLPRLWPSLERFYGYWNTGQGCLRDHRVPKIRFHNKNIYSCSATIFLHNIPSTCLSPASDSKRCLSHPSSTLSSAVVSLRTLLPHTTRE